MADTTTHLDRRAALLGGVAFAASAVGARSPAAATDGTPDLASPEELRSSAGLLDVELVAALGTADLGGRNVVGGAGCR